jgi:hypothetical protein
MYYRETQAANVVYDITNQVTYVSDCNTVPVKYHLTQMEK